MNSTLDKHLHLECSQHLGGVEGLLSKNDHVYLCCNLAERGKGTLVVIEIYIH